MTKRVGWKRKPTQQRKDEIYNEIARQTVGTGMFATVYSIAHALKMSPSTHLYNLCHLLVMDDEIDLLYRESERPAYRFYLSIERVEKLRTECVWPYHCLPGENTSTSICREVGGKICAVSFMED